MSCCDVPTRHRKGTHHQFQGGWHSPEPSCPASGATDPGPGMTPNCAAGPFAPARTPASAGQMIRTERWTSPDDMLGHGAGSWSSGIRVKLATSGLGCTHHGGVRRVAALQAAVRDFLKETPRLKRKLCDDHAAVAAVANANLRTMHQR